ncbi:MAG: hypothetical protein WC216_01910 [Gallionella sp.]
MNLNPKSMFLLNDIAIQIKQSINTLVFMHGIVYQLMIMLARIKILNIGLKSDIKKVKRTSGTEQLFILAGRRP